MLNPQSKIKMLIIGVHLSSEGYPNVRYRIQDFRHSDWLDLTEINVPMWKNNVPSKHHKLRFISGLFRASYAHLSVIIKYLLHGRANLAYVPYPSVFTGLILGFLPRIFRPKTIVLDAFISLYDTVVNDRKLLPPSSLISIILKYIEKRAYSCADLIIVDTLDNVSYLCREFSLSKNKVVDIPLSTNEKNFQPQPYLANHTVCQVLFVGTFIPLHGLETILSAAILLKNERNIIFKIIGSGQTSAEIELIVKKGEANLEWICTWQSPESLAKMIQESDICLGIFGAGGKTQRVCPLKLYAYAACGRAIITGDTKWTRKVRKKLAYEPFETVTVDNGIALANSIKKLSNSPAYRQQLAQNSQRYYEQQLCNNIALSRLKSLLYEE